MSEQTYWLIELTDFTHAPKRKFFDGYYLQYYPEGIEDAVAEVVFTDLERAERYAARVCNSEHTEWRAVFVEGRGQLSRAIHESIPKKTHVLLDPEYGDEEAHLHPIIWEEGGER
jgi:hypothetical protein